MLPGLLWAWNNRPNRLLLPVWLFATVAISSAQGIIAFWVSSVLQPPRHNTPLLYGF